jgi:hypothetical protein
MINIPFGTAVRVTEMGREEGGESNRYDFAVIYKSDVDIKGSFKLICTDGYVTGWFDNKYVDPASGKQWFILKKKFTVII